MEAVLGKELRVGVESAFRKKAYRGLDPGRDGIQSRKEEADVAGMDGAIWARW